MFVSWCLVGILTVLLGLILKAMTLGWWNVIPAGVTGMVFSALSVYVDEVPGLYKHRLVTSSPTPGQADPWGVTLSDKSTNYLLAAQLAMSQFPYSLLPAAVGWVVGSAWRGDLLPGGMGRWRVPRWVVGEGQTGAKDGGQYEGLRRRLEAEGSGSDGMRNVADSARSEERTGFLGQIGRYFGGS